MEHCGTSDTLLGTTLHCKVISMYICRVCGEPIDDGRADLGYRTCLVHGDLDAKARKFCVVPMHKSNYVAVFDRDLLTGVNQKGGIVK